MKEIEAAEKLARSLADTAAAMGKRVIALLTDMDQPLGAMVGNFLEVEEALDCLEGKGPPDLMEVSLELAARMAVLGGKAASAAEGRRLCEEALAGDKVRNLFLANIASQGGDAERLLSLRGAYRSPVSAEIRSPGGGFISRIDAWKVGHAGVQLGTGRNRTDETVSPTAGVQFHKRGGDPVSPGDLVMSVWARDEQGLAAALPQLAEAVEYAGRPPAKRNLILKELVPA
jgi:pyrimidine-nucleoside phosphorylase